LPKLLRNWEMELVEEQVVLMLMDPGVLLPWVLDSSNPSFITTPG
jgi:hypothetical protein